MRLGAAQGRLILLFPLIYAFGPSLTWSDVRDFGRCRVQSRNDADIAELTRMTTKRTFGRQGIGIIRRSSVKVV